jgi:N-methylhydantoinase B/oxoprolinase/acetone carboxylase alpha subunit
MTILNRYLNLLQEQKFNSRIALTEIDGEFQNEWTRCYETRCAENTNMYQQKICKSRCQITAANKAVARIEAAKSKCSTTNNPQSCLKVMKHTADRLREKISHYEESQRKAQVGLTKFRRTGV